MTKLVNSISSKPLENDDPLLNLKKEKKLKPLVLAGPSGVGKGTLVNMLLNSSYSHKIGLSVSHTTRKARKGEIDGVHYHFTSVERMKKDIESNKFIETNFYNGNYYGTSYQSVLDVTNSGKICILEIDVNGCETIKKNGLDAHYVFIAPPHFDELERRLRSRMTETEESIRQRLATAKYEIEYSTKSGFFDHIIVNDDLETTFQKIIKILSSELEEN